MSFETHNSSIIAPIKEILAISKNSLFRLRTQFSNLRKINETIKKLIEPRKDFPFNNLVLPNLIPKIEAKVSPKQINIIPVYFNKIDLYFYKYI